MANYIISANTNPERKIRTNTSGLSKSIKVLLDEGYESVTVSPVVERGPLYQPKFKEGQQVKVIGNNTRHQFSIGDTVIIGTAMQTPVGYSYHCSGYADGEPDCWWAIESDLAECSVGKFKEGDKVQIIENFTGHNFPIGQRCTVSFADVDENGESYLVRSGDQKWWVGPKDVKKV